MKKFIDEDPKVKLDEMEEVLSDVDVTIDSLKEENEKLRK